MQSINLPDTTGSGKGLHAVDPMWTVTGSNGFLPLLRPLPSYSLVLGGGKDSWQPMPTSTPAIQLHGQEGEQQRSSPASTGADSKTVCEGHAYVSALLALEAVVSSLPSHAARVSDVHSLARACTALSLLDVKGLLLAVEAAKDMVGHPLHGLALLPRAVLLYSLFRDYSVLSASYVYEPRGKALRELAPWEDSPGGAASRPLQADSVKMRADTLSKQSLPRASLPPPLSIPLVTLSQLTGLPPILEYTSYCLGCHGRADYDVRPVVKDVLPGLPPRPPEGSMKESKGVVEGEKAQLGSQAPGQPALYTPQVWPWHALRLYRPMDGGTNEGAFILLHAEIEAHGGALVCAIRGLLEEGLRLPVQGQMGGVGEEGAPAVGVLHPPNKAAVLSHLQSMTSSMRSIIVSQLKMFNICDPAAYEARTRPWIFGYKGNEDLPHGVLYEGVKQEQVAAAGWAGNIVPGPASSASTGVRLALRGETGAQSTLIPTMDILLGITHKGDTLKDMLVELEQYRPVGHRQWLRALRQACWGDGSVPAGSAPGDLAGSRGYTAAIGQAGTGAEQDSMDMEAAHAVRDYIRSTGDRGLVRAFNGLVQQVWAFRSIHVAYADLYIARVTAREGATGGTPYKAYLRKHRDESRAHQIWDGPGGAADCMLSLPYTLDPSAFTAEVEACLQPSTANCIPRHLLDRHGADIQEFGRQDPALLYKCW